MLIGKRIKRIRESRDMTLTELARQSGIQIATLCRIENQKMTGTIESHLQIAKALGIDLTDLYKNIESEAAEPDATAKKPVAETFTYNDRASYEILTSKLLRKRMMPILLKIEEGGATNPEQNSPGAEKFIFVLKGEITATVDKETYPLKANSSLYFDASVRHHFINKGKGTAKAICVTTPVTL